MANSAGTGATPPDAHRCTVIIVSSNKAERRCGRLADAWIAAVNRDGHSHYACNLCLARVGAQVRKYILTDNLLTD